MELNIIGQTKYLKNIPPLWRGRMALIVLACLIVFPFILLLILPLILPPISPVQAYAPCTLLGKGYGDREWGLTSIDMVNGNTNPPSPGLTIPSPILPLQVRCGGLSMCRSGRMGGFAPATEPQPLTAGVTGHSPGNGTLFTALCEHTRDAPPFFVRPLTLV